MHRDVGAHRGIEATGEKQVAERGRRCFGVGVEASG
jgi:hypothetical protein